MVKSRINKTFFVVLVAALLSLQWTTRHVHLPQIHSHGDVEHQHAAVAHSHLPTSHHDGAIDVADVHADYTVVAFNDDNTAVSAGTPGKRLIASRSPVLTLSLQPQRSKPLARDRLILGHGYLERSTVRLRAPPVIA